MFQADFVSVNKMNFKTTEKPWQKSKTEVGKVAIKMEYEWQRTSLG